MEKAAARPFSTSESLQIDPNTPKNSGRTCTQCRKWHSWEGFHKKKNRFASQCKPCILMQKKLSRKRRQKKQKNKSQNDIKFETVISGRLTQPLINEVSKIIAYAIRALKN